MNRTRVLAIIAVLSALFACPAGHALGSGGGGPPPVDPVPAIGIDIDHLGDMPDFRMFVWRDGNGSAFAAVVALPTPVGDPPRIRVITPNGAAPNVTTVTLANYPEALPDSLPSQIETGPGKVLTWIDDGNGNPFPWAGIMIADNTANTDGTVVDVELHGTRFDSPPYSDRATLNDVSVPMGLNDVNGHPLISGKVWITGE